MAMTRDEKIELGVIAGGGILIWWLLHKGLFGNGGDIGSGAVNLPNYLNYNNPANSENNDQGSLPQIGGTPGSNGSGQPSCSCGGSDTNFFGTLDSYNQALETNMSGFLTDYENALMSQFPDYVSQFFDNQSGILQQQFTADQLGSF